MAAAAPELLALDWGTSSLRAFLMAGGAVIDSRRSAHGIQHLPSPGRAGFEQAFAAIAGDWLQRWPRLPVVASGMVGSAQGWREAPYARCPAELKTLAAQGVTVDSGLGPRILIAPGVLLDAPGQTPDVMRGEEIQIAGALGLHPAWADGCRIVLPGTHSKWVQIERGRIVRFATYLTGELFAVLKAHSILGRLMPVADAVEAVDKTDAARAAAFALGLDAARGAGPGDLLHALFATRTLGLTARLPASALAEYLSGLLIGSEIVSGLAAFNTGAALPWALIGEPMLCERYAASLRRFGLAQCTLLDNTAPAGLWRLARAARLLPA